MVFVAFTECGGVDFFGAPSCGRAPGCQNKP